MAGGGSPNSDADQLIRQYADLIASVVRRVGGRRVALVEDDVRQKVHVALWEHLRREPNVVSPASYIYRMAVRETVRAVRRESSPPWERSRNDVDASALPAPTDPERVMESKETAEAIEAGLASLATERSRAVRAHFEGFSVEEIMSLNAWPYQKARNLVARGIKDLRSALRKRGIHG
jgi:RNA polymerase sigma factor (sigma-70 family)